MEAAEQPRCNAAGTSRQALGTREGFLEGMAFSRFSLSEGVCVCVCVCVLRNSVQPTQ